ncbi:unnamed protein product [Lepeophtheirus salmonis]|uniref:(salmon louse) hypothetical protein n=1 Tax=Lepeophtheirus salmonis TaxID=72036 RepID=A0A7R8D8H5_LEPSM|nr:unnamed protein product [Lepeophtheirus salmonis]CAF3036684.1 unnamed protein product [Lepeophtheirus salmonis]
MHSIYIYKSYQYYCVLNNRSILNHHVYNKPLGTNLQNLKLPSPPANQSPYLLNHRIHSYTPGQCIIFYFWNDGYPVSVHNQRRSALSQEQLQLQNKLGVFSTDISSSDFNIGIWDEYHLSPFRKLVSESKKWISVPAGLILE